MLPEPAAPLPPAPSRRQRFLASYVWLILKNVIGWVLILAALVAGPLVPGPGGIPLFLIGFALISFPGKRRLTARVLRGRPVRAGGWPFVFVCLLVALAVPAVALAAGRRHVARVAWVYERGPLALAGVYAAAAAAVWLAARASPAALNLLLRGVARGRRKFRPWLRRHRIHLLPPRWRRRHAHEHGEGPLRLKDEILGFGRKGK